MIKALLEKEAKTEQKAENTTANQPDQGHQIHDDQIAIKYPGRCINIALIFIKSLILIESRKITADRDLEVIFLPQEAATYQEAIYNFIKAIL